MRCCWEYLGLQLLALLKKNDFHGIVESSHRSGRKPKFTVSDEVQLSRIIISNRRGTLDNIKSEINNAKDTTFSLKPLRKKKIKWDTIDGCRRWSSEYVTGERALFNLSAYLTAVIY